jgi:predicted nucleotidyltransferase
MIKNDNKILLDIKEIINSIDPEAEVYLFGSRARGTEQNLSDWDFLILTDNIIDMEYESLIRDKIYDFELETSEDFSIFLFNKDDWNNKQRITPFYQNVMNEGVAL